MFSSNQILEISGSLSQLEQAIDFAMEYSGEKECFTRKNKPAKCVYQITDDGRYCIGWSFGKTEAGWTEYPFDYDASIISKIIIQHIGKLDKPFNELDADDGTYKVGFVLQAGPGRGMNGQKVKNDFYCIISIRPFFCYYAK